MPVCVVALVAGGCVIVKPPTLMYRRHAAVGAEPVGRRGGARCPGHEWQELQSCVPEALVKELWSCAVKPRPA